MTRGEQRYEIPQGTAPAKCRGCAAQIYWVKTRAGKNMPVDAGGQSHFETCPMAQKFRKGGADGGRADSR